MSGAINNLKNLNIIRGNVAHEDEIVLQNCDTDRFNKCFVSEGHYGLSVLCEDLNSLISSICYIEIPPTVDVDVTRFCELPWTCPFSSPYLDYVTAEIVFLDPMVTGIDDVDVPVCICDEVCWVTKLLSRLAKCPTHQHANAVHIKHDKPMVARINDTNFSISSNANPSGQIELNFSVLVFVAVSQSTARHDVEDSVYQVAVLDSVVICISDVEEFSPLKIDSYIGRIVKFSCPPAAHAIF